MAYFGVINEQFNQSVFDVCFDYSEQICLDYVQRYKPDLQGIDMKQHWQDIFKQEKENGQFYIEGYEVIHNGHAMPVGYFVAKIENEKLICNVFLPAKRASTIRPVVADLNMWDDLMQLTKSLGCKEYIWQSDKHGRIWKAFKIMSRKLNYDVTLIENDGFGADVYSEMRLKFKQC